MIFAKQTAQATPTQAKRLRLQQPFIFNGQVCWSNLDLAQMENNINKDFRATQDTETTQRLH